MIKNYLTIALRSLFRNRVYSTINIAGLGLGIACSFLIALFLREEWTFDTFHGNAKSIYRAYVKEDYGENEKFFNTVTPFPLGPALKENFQEVRHFVRITTMESQLKVKDQQFAESVTIADTAFFEMFDFPLIEGNAENVLTQASNIVLTRSAAVKFFGRTDVVNEVVSIQLGETFEDFRVAGVAEDVPGNSSVTFNCLISSHNLPKLYRERALTSAWFNVTPETYVQLNEGVDANALMDKFPSLFKSILGEEEFASSKYFVGLQPLLDIHLNSDFPKGAAPVSNPRYAYILAGVAVLVLFLACINFVTLSIGRTLKRAKEVGIRKVVGAVRAQLVAQFIGEAVVTTFISLILGVALAGVSLPLFNELSGKNLKLEPEMFTIITGLALMTIIGILAGSYPAFVLSSFRPIAILKGKLQGASRHTMRKVLVSIQLVLAVFLISSALVMRKQLTYLQDKNLGFNKDQLIVMPLSVPRIGKLEERVNKAFEKAELLKHELSSNQEVLAMCAASHDFGKGDWTEVGYTDDKGVYRGFSVNVVDAAYLEAMQMQIVAGRGFSSASPSDARRSVVVNEAFSKEYGWDNPVGKKIPGKDFIDHEIIGVVKDFNYHSLYTTVKPLVVTMNPAIPFSGSENVNFDNSPIPKLFIRIRGGQVATTLAALEAAWTKVAGTETFDYAFVDENIGAQYRNDQNLGKIIGIATFLSVVIGGLGLYALAALAIQARVKEISIRKVMGATVQSLLMLLSKEFVALLVINIAVSIPLTLYFMQRWLQSFQYRVDINWTLFAIAGGIAITIGLFTISFEAVKAALAKPAEKLKEE